MPATLSLLGLSVISKRRIAAENHIRLYASSTMWNGSTPAVIGWSRWGVTKNC